MSRVRSGIDVMVPPEGLLASLVAQWEDEREHLRPVRTHHSGLGELRFVARPDGTAEAHDADRLAVRVEVAPGPDGSRLVLLADYRPGGWGGRFGDWIAGRWLRRRAIRRCLNSWKRSAEREWTLTHLESGNTNPAIRDLETGSHTGSTQRRN